MKKNAVKEKRTVRSEEGDGRRKYAEAVAREKQKQEEGLTASSRTHVLTKVRLPQRVCCSRPGAMPVQHMRASEQAQDDISPEKN